MELATELLESMKTEAVESSVAIWSLAKAFDQWGEISHQWFWRFLAHYLTGDGAEFTTFKAVPLNWQNAIRKNWSTSTVKAVQQKFPKRYPKGKTFRIKPYNWQGQDDLVRSLGHFDLTYSKKGKTETYVIADVYEFNYYDEMKGTLSDHGGKDVELPVWLSEKMLQLMPQNEYAVPDGPNKGTVQRFKMEKTGSKTWNIILPTGWLRKHGTPFHFRAEFSSQFNIEDYIAAFEEGWILDDLDEDDLANDLMFLNNTSAVVKVFKALQKHYPSNATSVAEYYVRDLEARTTSPKLADLKNKPGVVTILKSLLKNSDDLAKLKNL